MTISNNRFKQKETKIKYSWLSERKSVREDLLNVDFTERKKIPRMCNANVWKNKWNYVNMRVAARRKRRSVGHDVFRKRGRSELCFFFFNCSVLRILAVSILFSGLGFCGFFFSIPSGLLSFGVVESFTRLINRRQVKVLVFPSVQNSIALPRWSLLNSILCLSPKELLRIPLGISFLTVKCSWGWN